MKWQSIQLREVCSVTPGFAFKSSEFSDSGIPVVKISNIRDDYKVDLSDVQCWPRELFSDKLSKFILKDKDIIIAMTGATAGKVGRVRTEQPLLLNQRVAKIEALKINPDFLWFALSSEKYRERFFLLAGGAAQPNMSGGQIETVEITFPPRSIQEKIADILSAYDDFIENNNRRMALLEESARLLYREWFVRLRFPGHEHSRLVNGVPEGWMKGVVSDFYDTASGGTPSRKQEDYFIGNIPWVKTQELLNSFITDTQEKISEDALEKSAAKIFPARTILIAMYGATIGQLGILGLPSATNQACCALMPRDKRADYTFAYLFFRENKSSLVNLSQGAAQNNINQQIIRNFEMTMPNEMLMTQFRESVENNFDLILNLQHQNQKLKAARDLLLPRLMNGELAV